MGMHGANCFGKVSSCLCHGFSSRLVSFWCLCIDTFCVLILLLVSKGVPVGAEEPVRGGLKYKWRTGHSTPSPAALREFKLKS